MRIKFLGAAQTVTGSKHLITLQNGKNLLLDCGMYQGLGQDTFELNSHFGFDPMQIDYMVLSHAHIDHSGLIPRLVHEGFKGKIYCTPATYDLCEIMLADSAYIQEQDIRYVNKRKRKQGKKELKPLYNMKDVNKCLLQFEPIPYDQEVKIDDFIHLTYTDNGHILGSATVNLRITDGSYSRHIAFTGDIGRYNSWLLKDPKPFPQADVLICESTYGNRLHSDLKDAAQEILDAVIETCSVKRGKLIIPAFSLGRTQEIIYALNKLDLHGMLPNVKIYVDSPLAVSATDITRKHVKCLNEKVQEFAKERPDPFGFNDLIYVQNREESQALNQIKEPCIIISASGMAEAGRVKHHIMHGIENPANTILIVGYAEPMSLAGKLRAGEKEVTIFSESYKVNADIHIIDAFSAHGDYKEMTKYLLCQDPKKVEKIFLVHGDIEAQEFYKDYLKEHGFGEIHIPKRYSEYFI